MAVYTQLSKAQIIRLLKKYDLGSLLNFKGIKRWNREYKLSCNYNKRKIYSYNL